MFDAARVLRAVRRAGNLSQRELAARAGVAPATIGAIEAGGRKPGVAMLERLVRAADCRVSVVDSDGVEVVVDDEHDGSVVPDHVYWHRERPEREGEWREHPWFGPYQARMPPEPDGGERSAQSRPSEGPPEPPPA